MTDPAGSQGSAHPPVAVEELDRLKKRASRLRRFRTAIVLSVVFVLLVIVAYQLYPRRPPVSRPPLYSLVVRQYVPLTALQVEVTEKPAGHYQLMFTVVVGKDTGSAKRSVSITFQPSEKVQHLSCVPSVACSATMRKGQQSIAVRPRGFNKAPGAYYYTLPEISFVSTHFAWDANGLQLEATVPTVSVLGCPKGCLGASLQVQTTYGILDGSSYTFSGGPPPSSVQPSSVAWTIPVAQLATPNTVSATNLSAADRDTLKTFAAGAILGIAGGALVGAVQEFMDSEARTAASRARRRRRRGVQDAG